MYFLVCLYYRREFFEGEGLVELIWEGGSGGERGRRGR